MIKLLIVLFIFCNSVLASQTKSIVMILDAEINTIERMVLKRKDAKLYHRLIELYTEKAEKSRELENKLFFDAIKTNSSLEKDSFFKDSLSYATKSIEVGKSLISLHKNYKDLGDVYLTLAFNCRDYLKDCNPENYYLQALTYFKNIEHKRNIVEGSLADYYYNVKKYDQAINLYEKLTKIENSDLWNKYAYNYAWCLLKKEKKKEALDLIKKIYFKAKDDKKVELISLLQQQLPIFFYQSREFDHALEFFQAEYSNFPTPAFKLGQSIYKKGEYKLGEKYLLKTLETKVEDNKKIEGYLILVDLYKQTHEYDKLLNILSTLVNFHKQKIFNGFNLDETNELLLAIVDIKNELLRRDDEHTKLKLANSISTIYQTLIYFDPTKTDEYSFYSGEIYYSINQKLKSMNFYESCLKHTSVDKYANLCMESIFALDKEGFYKKDLNRLEQVLITYSKLKLNKYLSLVIKRLFAIYSEQKEYIKKREAYALYLGHFTQDLPILTEMSKEIVQDAIQIKELETLELIAHKIQIDELKLTPNLKDNYWMFLGNFYLEYIAKNPDQALAFAERILKLPFVPSDIKLKASFNMALGFHKKSNAQDTITWLKPIFKESEFFNAQKEYFLTFIDEFFNNYDLESFNQYSHLVASNICTLKDGKVEFYTKLKKYYEMNLDQTSLGQLEDIKSKCQFEYKDNKVAEDKLLTLITMNDLQTINQFSQLSLSVQNLSKLPVPFAEDVFAANISGTLEQLVQLKNLINQINAENNLKYFLTYKLNHIYISVIDSFKIYKPKISDANLAWSIRTTMKTINKQLEKDRQKLSPNKLVKENISLSYKLLEDYFFDVRAEDFISRNDLINFSSFDKKIKKMLEENMIEKAVYFLKQNSSTEAKELLVKIYIHKNFMSLAQKEYASAHQEDKVIIDLINGKDVTGHSTNHLLQSLIFLRSNEYQKAFDFMHVSDNSNDIAIALKIYAAIKLNNVLFYNENISKLKNDVLKSQLEYLVLSKGNYHANN